MPDKTAITRPRVLAALSTFEDEPAPSDVEVLVTAEYRLVRYPERFVSPTFPAVQVAHLNLARSFDSVYEELEQIVRPWGADAVHWWVTGSTAPRDVERSLVERGATLSDDAQVLARSLDTADVALQVPANITVEEARDGDIFRAASAIETSGWGRVPLNETELHTYVEARLAERSSTDRFCVVAYLDDVPAAVGWCAVKGEAARLWGAVTLAEYRGRGCYHGVLAARLDIAREQGATMAITRGRASTSAPILIGAGFSVHDEERCYRLGVG